MKKISEFQCVTIFEVLKYAGLCSENSLNEIEQELLQLFDVKVILLMIGTGLKFIIEIIN